EERDATRYGLAVLGGVLVDQAPVARQVDEQHPARAAGERVAHRNELALPAVNRPEIARERFCDRRGRLTAFATEAREIQLVQERRIERAQFLALEPVDHIARRGLEIERGELLRNSVQAPERAAIVVFVVALDQLEGQGVQQPRPTVYR